MTKTYLTNVTRLSESFVTLENNSPTVSAHFPNQLATDDYQISSSTWLNSDYAMVLSLCSLYHTFDKSDMVIPDLYSAYS